MQFSHKVVVVTGAGSGMGRELTLALLKKGARVAAVDLHEHTLAETKALAAELGSQLSFHVLNVADEVGVRALPKQVIAAHGQVDGVINNAGIIQPFVKVQNLDDAAIDRVMKVNFYGVLGMTRAFLPHLLERPEACLVNVSSMGGFLPVPGQSVYGASKAAVKLLTEGLQSELSDTKVQVSVVFPGAINTNITANSGVEAPRIAGGKQYKTLSAPEAARIIIDGIERKKVRIFVGSDSTFMDRLYRLSPGYATGLITKQMRGLLAK